MPNDALDKKDLSLANINASAGLDVFDSKVSELWAEEAADFLRKNNEKILANYFRAKIRLRQEFRETWVRRLLVALDNNEEKTEAVLETHKTKLMLNKLSYPIYEGSVQDGQQPCLTPRSTTNSTPSPKTVGSKLQAQSSSSSIEKPMICAGAPSLPPKDRKRGHEPTGPEIEPSKRTRLN